MKNLPLISCLCVTHKKPHFLNRVIDCFLGQTYPNKELVIVYEQDDIKTRTFLNCQTYGENIVLVEIHESNLTLGELRNISVINAKGHYICQWDDDDWYHTNRLTVQYLSLLNAKKEASILTRWLLYDNKRNKSYLSHERLWEGSLLCQRNLLLQNPYEKKVKGEDTPFIDYLISMNMLSLINMSPTLYIYNYHGQNTWDYSHFTAIFEKATMLPPELAGYIPTLMDNKCVIKETILNKINSYVENLSCL